MLRKRSQSKKFSLTAKFVDPVVTEIVEAPTFYKAEAQDYYRKNPTKAIVTVIS